MLCFLLCYCLLFLHPTPSYFQSPESNQDDTSNDDDDDANSTTTTTSVDSEDSDDTINDTMAKSSKSTASAAAKKSTKKPNNKKTTGMEAINLDTPRGRSHMPSPQPCATPSTQREASPSTPTLRGQRTRSTLSSMKAVCPPRMPSPITPCYLGG